MSKTKGRIANAIEALKAAKAKKYKDSTCNKAVMESIFNMDDGETSTDYMKSHISMLKDSSFTTPFMLYVMQCEDGIPDVYGQLTKNMNSELDQAKKGEKYAMSLGFAKHMDALSKSWANFTMTVANDFNTDTNRQLSGRIQDALGPAKMEAIKDIGAEHYSDNKNNAKVDDDYMSEDDKLLDEGIEHVTDLFVFYSAFNATQDVDAANESLGAKVRKVQAKAAGTAEKVSDVATDAKVREQKLGQAFDDMINRKLKELRDDRKKQRYNQMVNGSLSLSREIGRALKTLPINFIAPGVGTMLFIATFFYDKHIDKKYKNQFLGDLRLQEKILEERISTADRKGDDNEKIRLIAEKDKISRTIERFQRSGFANE